LEAPVPRRAAERSDWGEHIDDMFFVGSSLVTLSLAGRVGVWNTVTKNWQVRRPARAR